jgi:hypothetical protein
VADFISLTCPSCGGKLQITNDIERFACGHCGNEHIVRRGGGIISLSPVIEQLTSVKAGVDKTASELAIQRLNDEIIILNNKKADIQRNYIVERQKELQLYEQKILEFESIKKDKRIADANLKALGVMSTIAILIFGISFFLGFTGSKQQGDTTMGLSTIVITIIFIAIGVGEFNKRRKIMERLEQFKPNVQAMSGQMERKIAALTLLHDNELEKLNSELSILNIQLSHHRSTVMNINS